MQLRWHHKNLMGNTFRYNSPWIMVFGVLLIILLAAALRFFRLGEWSFWIDEIFTVNHALSHFSTPELLLQHIPPARNWFPVSVILTAQIFREWGVNEFNARLAASLIGIITLPVLFFPIRKIFGVRVAVLVILLLAVSPWHLEWSQNARGYTALMLFYSLALFAFYFWLEKDRVIYIILFFIFLYLASSERMIALFILPVLGIYLLVLWILPIEKPPGLRAKNMVILISPAVLFAVAQIYQYIQSGESIAGSIFNEIMSTFLGRPIENPAIQTTFMVFKIGMPLFIVSLFGAIFILWQRNRHGLLFVLGAIVPFALVVLVTPFMFTEERYAFVSLPSWLILAALAVDTLLLRLKKWEMVLSLGVLFALLFDAMGANLLYYHINHGNRRNWKGAFALVEQNMRSGDVVVSTWPQLGKYYLKQDVQLWDEVEVESLSEGSERVWFVVIPDMAWYTGTEDLYWWVSHNTRMVKSQYLRTIDDANLEIYLYDPALSSMFQPLK